MISKEEEYARLSQSAAKATEILDILDGLQADVIHMCLGMVVASYAKAIDPEGFIENVAAYARSCDTSVPREKLQ